VRGHSGHPDNERCDALANAARQADDLLADDGYENEPDLLFGDFDSDSAHA
jgi:ribonuclease HI